MRLASRVVLNSGVGVNAEKAKYALRRVNRMKDKFTT